MCERCKLYTCWRLTTYSAADADPSAEMNAVCPLFVLHDSTAGRVGGVHASLQLDAGVDIAPGQGVCASDGHKRELLWLLECYLECAPGNDGSFAQVLQPACEQPFYRRA